MNAPRLRAAAGGGAVMCAHCRRELAVAGYDLCELCAEACGQTVQRYITGIDRSMWAFFGRGYSPPVHTRVLRPLAEPPPERRPEARPARKGCSNPHCIDGWVPWEPNESRAAPPIACQVCKRRLAVSATQRRETIEGER